MLVSAALPPISLNGTGLQEADEVSDGVIRAKHLDGLRRVKNLLEEVLMGALIHRTIIRQITPDEDFVEKFTELTRYLYRAQPPVDDD